MGAPAPYRRFKLHSECTGKTADYELSAINRKRWDGLSAAGVRFSRPWMSLSKKEARQTLLAAYLEGNVHRLNVLCLAAGGGQQSAVFGVLGSRVTVLDFSERQLAQDRAAADHYGYTVQLELGDMRDLSQFDTNVFDIIWHAWSINFVPDPWGCFEGVARTLTSGGTYVLEFANPAAVNVDRHSWDGRSYTIAEPFRDGAERTSLAKWTWCVGDRIVRRTAPREWMHSLDRITTHLSDLGLLIERCNEYPVGDINAPPGSLEHSYAFASPSLRITSHLSSE